MAGEWTSAPIQEVAEKVAMGPFGSSIKVETFVPHGVPVISGQHLHVSRLRDLDFNFISLEHAAKLANANVRRGDVVFTHAGNIGQVAYIPESSKYERYVISQRQFYLRPKREKVLPEFIAYYFMSPEGQHKLLANTSSSGVPSIAQPVSYLRTVEIPVPPLSEQRAIAHILGTLDDKIELDRRMNETLEAIAQALFKSWFVDFDPVRAKAGGRDHNLPKTVTVLFPNSFEGSALGEIPKGWQVRSLYQTASFVNGAAFGSGDFCAAGEGPPVVKIAELKDGITVQTRFSRRDLPPDQRIDTGDLLYSWSGSPDTSLDAFVWAKGYGLLNQHIFKVVTTTPAEKVFVHCCPN